MKCKPEPSYELLNECNHLIARAKKVIFVFGAIDLVFVAIAIVGELITL